MELTDIHNRRSNIATVAEDCKANHYPLLAWPEDKELLRLGDLPQFVQANKRPTWTGLEPKDYHVVTSDRDLRAVIREGFGYSLVPSIQHLANTFLVVAWAITTR